MHVYLGADHGGFELKERIKRWLVEWGHTWEDLGNTTYDKGDDYPPFALAVAEKVGKTRDAIGILACRSAAGMVIAANKVKGVRAITVHDENSAGLAREKNDANVVVLSGDWLSEKEAKKILKVFLETPFSGEERHIRRIKTIEEYENKTP
ncbi:MAG: RpiB/LacA/LacB family sugar-phosphate isomerase [Patescibacteria group bacterium]